MHTYIYCTVYTYTYMLTHIPLNSVFGLWYLALLVGHSGGSG